MRGPHRADRFRVGLLERPRARVVLAPPWALIPIVLMLVGYALTRAC